jgi:hypothetical protein
MVSLFICAICLYLRYLHLPNPGINQSDFGNTKGNRPVPYYTVPVLEAVQGETLLRVLVRYGIACALAAEIGALASSDTLSHGDKIRVVLWPRNNQSPIERPPDRNAAWRSRSLRLTAEQAPDQTATAVYKDIWFSSDALPK